MAILNHDETKALSEACDAMLQRDAGLLSQVLDSQMSDRGCLGVMALEKLCSARSHSNLDEDFCEAFHASHPQWACQDEGEFKAGVPFLGRSRPMFPSIWGSVSDEANASQVLEILKALHGHGWRANVGDMRANWSLMAPILVDIGLLEFTISKDLWTSSEGLPVRCVSKALRGQGERELALVDALVAKRIWLQDPKPGREDDEGVLALLSAGLPKCAMRLMERGIKPKASKNHTRVSTSWGAIGAGLNANIANSTRWPQTSGGDASMDSKELIEAMLASGCDLGALGEDPCWALVDQARWGWAGLLEGVDHPMTSECIDALVAAGADPKKSGRFMGEAVARLDCVGFDLAIFDKAIALGCLDESSHGYALSAPARWDVKGAQKAAKVARSKQWFDKIAALGADPSKLPKASPCDRHPVAYAVQRASFGLANHALDKGVAPDWIDSESGSGILHMLAGKKSAEPKKLLSRLLADPRMSCLIGRANLKGETPLMAACKALDQAMVDALIGAGAGVDARDAKGRSALMHAGLKFGEKADQSSNGIVAKLLACGANPSLVDAKGRTAAQAMAAAAPLDALQTVLSACPQDLSPLTEQGVQAMKDAQKRGAQVLSVVEKTLLDAQKNQSNEGDPAPRRTRL